MICVTVKQHNSMRYSWDMSTFICWEASKTNLFIQISRRPLVVRYAGERAIKTEIASNQNEMNIQNLSESFHCEIYKFSKFRGKGGLENDFANKERSS